MVPKDVLSNVTTESVNTFSFRLAKMLLETSLKYGPAMLVASKVPTLFPAHNNEENEMPGNTHELQSANTSQNESDIATGGTYSSFAKSFVGYLPDFFCRTRGQEGTAETTDGDYPDQNTFLNNNELSQAWPSARNLLSSAYNYLTSHSKIPSTREAYIDLRKMHAAEISVLRENIQITTANIKELSEKLTTVLQQNSKDKLCDSNDINDALGSIESHEKQEYLELPSDLNLSEDHDATEYQRVSLLRINTHKEHLKILNATQSKLKDILENLQKRVETLMRENPDINTAMLAFSTTKLRFN